MSEEEVEPGLKLFYSYSHQDENLKDQLDKHLSLLQRQKLITTWHDRRITAGAEWKGAIDGNLAAANVILLLVSADFISSDYCFDVEMKLALEMHQANNASVIPIILRSVDWSDAPFADLQALPRNGKPVTKWKDLDEAFTNIAEGIKETILARLAENPAELDVVEVEDSTDPLPLPKPLRRIHKPNFPETNRLNATTIGRIVRYLAARFDGQLHQLDPSKGVLGFTIDLHHVCLRGTDDPIPCIAIWDDARDLADALRKLAAEASRSFGIIFCFSDAKNIDISRTESMKGCCVLSLSDIRILFSSRAPLDLLLKYVVAQIGIRRMSPYNVLLPARGSMFFGRTAELERLIQDRDTSYTIFGPSQIGKSSLLRHYRWSSLRTSWMDPSHIFYLDMSTVSDSNSALRFIAMQMEPSGRAERITEQNFLSFLRYKRNQLGTQIELLLDEVDDICTSPAFEQIGNAAKVGLIRLILCGRGGLMRFAMNPASRLSMRLQVLRPDALDSDASRDVMLKPMGDLGITYESEDCIDRISLMTGRLPFLLQYYGRALVDKAVITQSSVITMKMVKEFEDKFDTIHFMMRPILEIEGTTDRKMALALLRSKQSVFTISDISATATKVGEDIKPNQILELCNALCIYGVLAYEAGLFRIANEALRDSAVKSGYLDLVD